MKVNSSATCGSVGAVLFSPHYIDEELCLSGKRVSTISGFLYLVDVLSYMFNVRLKQLSTLLQSLSNV